MKLDNDIPYLLGFLRQRYFYNSHKRVRFVSIAWSGKEVPLSFLFMSEWLFVEPNAIDICYIVINQIKAVNKPVADSNITSPELCQRVPLESCEWSFPMSFPVHTGSYLFPHYEIFQPRFGEPS